jgi:hypothetical protein
MGEAFVPLAFTVGVGFLETCSSVCIYFKFTFSVFFSFSWSVSVDVYITPSFPLILALVAISLSYEKRSPLQHESILERAHFGLKRRTFGPKK